jgi:hypothetical protein
MTVEEVLYKSKREITIELNLEEVSKGGQKRSRL